MCAPKPIKLRGATIYAKTMKWTKNVIKNSVTFKSDVLNRDIA
jgi:hypothetical protein